MQETVQPEQNSEYDSRCSRRIIVVENEIHCCFVFFYMACKRKEIAMKMLVVAKFTIDTNADGPAVFISDDQAESHRKSQKKKKLY
jgi:hypothetical protein